MLLTETWIPTVFQPRSEHFPDSYGIHTGMHHVWVLWISTSNKGKNHVKLGVPISYINLWFQMNCTKIVFYKINKSLQRKSIEFKVNHK